MKQFVSQIWHSPSARNVGKLLSASVFAQAIGLLVYPILTRLYTPEDFGLLNLFLSIGGVLVIIATAQYQHAISVAGKDHEAKGAFYAGFSCLVVSSIALYLLLPFSRHMVYWFKAPDLADYAWLLPVYVICGGLWQLLNNWYIRQKAFGHISRYQVTQNLLAAGGKVGLGYGNVAGGLLYGGVGAIFLTTVCTLLTGWSKYFHKLWPYRWSEMRNAFHHFRNYPLFTLPSALINAINSNIAVWLITPIFGLEITGYWGMAMLLGYTPIALIGNSIYQVLVQNASAKVSAGQPIGSMFRRSMIQCACVVLPFFALLYVIMPWLVQLLLGNGWEDTTYILRVFLPWFALFCFSIPWNFLHLLFEKQNINLGIEITLLLSRLAVLGIGSYLHNLSFVIIAYSAVSAIILLIQLLWYGSLVKYYDQSVKH